MTKSKSAEKPKYSKSAFVDATKDSKEKLLLKMLLKDKTSYTQDEVAKLINEWKVKTVRNTESKEVKE